MKIKLRISPYAYPILFFAGAILVGAFCLHCNFSLRHNSISWIDSLFTATSATCVTGLAVVDTGTYFSTIGQIIILCLIQVGGLGIMTITSLIFYLWSKKISLTDKIAVGQGLLHDPTFSLGNFLINIVTMAFTIEALGALFLYILSPQKVGLFSSLFHSISAFCNAGFSLYENSLMDFKDNLGVNLVIMILIILGGLGFSVLQELIIYFKHKINHKRYVLSWHTNVVLSTTAYLILFGSLFIFLGEYVFGPGKETPLGESILVSLFQAVTCRTAGFNTVDIAYMTNVSLCIMILLMFIGGGPGSCAGGIKVTTFRVLWAYIKGQIFIKGKQAVIGRFAAKEEDLNKAVILFVFSCILISIGILILNITEGGEAPHIYSRGIFLSIAFEVVSAFGTVGLSTGLTPHLTFVGKCVVICLMFIGRLGPIIFLSLIQHIQEEPRFAWPKENILIG